MAWGEEGRRGVVFEDGETEARLAEDQDTEGRRQNCKREEDQTEPGPEWGWKTGETLRRNIYGHCSLN